MKKKLSLLAIVLQAFYLLLLTTPALVSIIYLVFHPYLFSHPPLVFLAELKFNSTYELLLIANFYTFYLLLFPQFVKTQRLGLFVFLSVLATLLTIGFA